MSDGIVFIGGGLGSYLAIAAIRAEDKEIPIRLITSDQGDYYHKPQISSALAVNKTAHDLKQADVETLSERHQISITPLTSVCRIDTETHEVITATGVYPYQHCVMACGALPRPLSCEGSGVARVLTVNHLSEYERLRQVIEGKKDVVIIGAGLVGVEMAYDLSHAGYNVTVIHDHDSPVQTLLPQEIGGVLAKAMSQVHWVWDAKLKCIDEDGPRLQVTLDSGNVYEADCVLSATGLQPNTALAEASNIAVHYGVKVDQTLQTSAPDVYAIGDCAEVSGLVYYYVFPIRHAAKALAATLLGRQEKVVYPAMPITLKTPKCPVVICPPPRGCVGTWALEGEGDQWSGLCHNESGEAIGFVLCGRSMLSKRADYLSMMPPWLS